MTEVGSWGETPAGLLANGGWVPGDRAAEWAEREAVHARDRAEFESRLAANPEWSAARRLQEAFAARGWTGNWVNVGPSTPPELQALNMAAAAAETRLGTFYEGRPTNDVAAAIEQHQRDRYEAAQLRLQAMNAHRPPLANPAPYDVAKSVAGSGDDDGWPL